MRFALPLALVIACGGSPAPGPTPPPAPSPAPAPAPAPSAPSADPLSYCKLAMTFIDELNACKAASGAFATNREFYEHLLTSPPDLARKSGAVCASFLEIAIGEQTAKGCTFSAAPRAAEIAAFLDAYYAERAQLVPTSDPATDAVLAKLAAQRDATCACADQACALAAAKELPDPLPKNAPPKALELGGQLIDDIGKCSRDQRFMRPKK